MNEIEKLKKKNILILTELYPDLENKVLGNPFVKSQVDEIKKYVNKVHVISPIPYFPKVLKRISILPSSYINYSKVTDYTYDNVSVFYPKFVTLPLRYFKIRNGNYAYSSTLKCIKRKKLEFDIIHAHFAWMSGYIGSKLKLKYNIPLIITLHGSPTRMALNPKLQPPSFKNQDIFLKKNLDYILDCADTIITSHPELYDLIIKNYTDKVLNKLHLIQKDINIEIFNPHNKIYKEKAEKLKRKYEIQHSFNVLFLAMIVKNKDPLTFISAACKMKDYADIKFILVGGGTLLDKIISIKKDKDIPNLIIVGPQENGPEWYLASDVFCALDNVENIWSGTLQEALCSGTPVIVVNTPQVTKHLKHKIDSYIIPIKDSDALVSAILELKKDLQLRKRLSYKKNEWRNRFDSKRITNYIINLYEDLLKEELIKNKSIKVINDKDLINKTG